MCWANGPIVAHFGVLRRRAGREEAGVRRGGKGRNGRGETGGDKDMRDGVRK